MGTTVQKDSALGHFEADLTVQFLPRCASCHSPHPIASKARDTSSCPQCGEPAAKLGPSHYEPALATLSGPFVLAARLFLQAGTALRKLAERVKP